MRIFAASNARLRRLGLGQRLIYTLFLGFSAVGLISAVLLYDAGPGWTLDSVRRYYRGEDLPPSVDAPPDAPAAPAGGPAIELPDFNPANQRGEPPVQQIAFARSYRQILENAHQHLFMMPVMFLILAHLVALSGIPRWAVVGLVGSGALGIAGHIAGPWLVRYVGGGWAWTMPVTLGLMLVGLFGMIGISLVAMWAGRGSESGRDAP